MADIVRRELCSEVKGKITTTQHVPSQRKCVKPNRLIDDSTFLNDHFELGLKTAPSDQQEPISDVSIYSKDTDSSDAESDSESFSDSYYSVVSEDVHQEAFRYIQGRMKP